MIDFTTMYATGMTILMAAFAWGYHRRAEIEDAAMKMYVAAKDGKIDETEFQLCADALGRVIYKK